MAEPEDDTQFKRGWATVIVIVGLAIAIAALSWSSPEQGLGTLILGLGCAAIAASFVAPGRSKARQPPGRPVFNGGILFALSGIVLLLDARAFAPLWVLIGLGIICAGVLVLAGGAAWRRPT